MVGHVKITDTNSGPVTIHRPAQTHNPIIADRDAWSPTREPAKCGTFELDRPTA